MEPVSKETLAMAHNLNEIETILAEELDEADAQFNCGYNLICSTN